MLKRKPMTGHYMAQLAENDRAATNLRSLDSSAMDAQDRMNAPEGDPMAVYHWEDHQRDRAAYFKLDRRNRPGSANSTPEDTMGE